MMRAIVAWTSLVANTIQYPDSAFFISILSSRDQVDSDVIYDYKSPR